MENMCLAEWWLVSYFTLLRASLRHLTHGGWSTILYEVEDFSLATNDPLCKCLNPQWPQPNGSHGRDDVMRRFTLSLGSVPTHWDRLLSFISFPVHSDRQRTLRYKESHWWPTFTTHHLACFEVSILSHLEQKCCTGMGERTQEKSLIYSIQ